MNKLAFMEWCAQVPVFETPLMQVRKGRLEPALKWCSVNCICDSCLYLDTMVDSAMAEWSNLAAAAEFEGAHP